METACVELAIVIVFDVKLWRVSGSNTFGYYAATKKELAYAECMQPSLIWKKTYSVVLYAGYNYIANQWLPPYSYKSVYIFSQYYDQLSLHGSTL